MSLCHSELHIAYMKNESATSRILNPFFLLGVLAVEKGRAERAGEEGEIRLPLALLDCAGALPCDMLAVAGWEWGRTMPGVGDRINDGAEILHVVFL